MPFIVAWGDKIKPAVSDYVGYFPDVMPTLCDIAGIECPHSDGISFLPTIKGKRQPQHDYLYWEFPPFKQDRGWLSIRMGQWKGLVEDVADGNTDMQLFDIKSDPREEKNVAESYPDVVRAMWQAVRESHTEIDNPLFQLDITYPKDR